MNLYNLIGLVCHKWGRRNCQLQNYEGNQYNNMHVLKEHFCSNAAAGVVDYRADRRGSRLIIAHFVNS